MMSFSMGRWGLILLVAAILTRPWPAGAEAGSFSRAAGYEVCFTPQQDCQGLILGLIAAARLELRLQAYSFTSRPIAAALIAAQHRGVDVRVLLDATNQNDRRSAASRLLEGGIPVAIDDTVAIAHSKVLIVDRRLVITGSANFTASARRRNAENVLILRDDQRLTEAYIENWEKRAAASKPLLPSAPGIKPTGR